MQMLRCTLPVPFLRWATITLVVHATQVSCSTFHVTSFSPASVPPHIQQPTFILHNYTENF